MSTHLITGAFGNTGAAIRALLEQEGHHVRTLTSKQPPQPADVDVFSWDDLAAFDGVDTFFNTFWMRTGDPGSHGRSYAQAIARSRLLFESARAAGVRRIVHISVAHADAPAAARYPYFAAKAEVERALAEQAIAHTIVRPALIFGGTPGILEQLVRVLRLSPVFGVAGDGQYRVRPVHVDDVARLCVTTAPGSIVDAVGPDRLTFDDLVRAVGASIGKRARLVHLPPRLVIAAGRTLGTVLREDLLTADELLSTIDGLADTDGPATGTVSIRDWLVTNRP